jgi:hypothetical protein
LPQKAAHGGAVFNERQQIVVFSFHRCLQLSSLY